MKNPSRMGWPFTSNKRRNQLLFVSLLTVTALTIADRARAEARRLAVSPVEFNIPAQSVPDALSEFARQAQVQLFFISDGFESIQANAVVGTYAAQDALDLLLAGTGLGANVSSESGVKVKPVSVPMSSLFLGSRSLAAADARANPTAAQQSNDQTRVPKQTRQDGGVNPEKGGSALEQIVVTGTSIRGVIPQSTPLEIYDAIDIRNTGALSVEGFIRMLPQNNNTLSELASGSSSREPNNDLSNSVDLRGLGVGSTLVLLNGRRMAPSSQGRSVDLSFIPIGAVERVEVLTDGASATYGADAIGGVVNFVLKDQQDGAETVLTVGSADGGNEQLRIDQSFGSNWSSGNALVALSYFHRNDLDAADRDFARAAAPFTLVPADIRKNGLATFSQLLPGDVRISGDLLHSTRRPQSAQTQSQFGADDFVEREIDLKQTVLNLAIDRPLGDKLSAALLITYADTSADATGFVDGPTIGVGPFLTGEDSNTLDLTAKVDGKLASFQSGPLMFALGAGYTNDEYETFRDYSAAGSSSRSTSALDRDTNYAFAELHAPIVSPEQNVHGVRRLEISLATRYTDYSDFGSNVSPKLGAIWSPILPLSLRATFGESFKAPFLFQLDPTSSNYGFFPIALMGTPDIWSNDNSTIMLFALGAGNPTLGPEQAETYTLGLDFNISGLTVSTTYFNIEYTDRIAEPDSTSGSASLVNPHDFPELFNVDPTPEEIGAILSTSRSSFNLTTIDTDDPAAVVAATTVLADNRIRNLSISKMAGLDIRVDYTAETSAGEFSVGVNAAKMFDFEERIFPSSSPVSKVDTVLYPASLKGHGYFGFAKDRWNARMNVNYVDRYDNPFDAANPTMDEWITVDLLFSYELPNEGRKFVDGVRMGLTIQNAFDEAPPFLAVGATSDFSLLVPTGFDPANANPIGRFLGFQISKKW